MPKVFLIRKRLNLRQSNQQSNQQSQWRPVTPPPSPEDAKPSPSMSTSYTCSSSSNTSSSSDVSEHQSIVLNLKVDSKPVQHAAKKIKSGPKVVVTEEMYQQSVETARNSKAGSNGGIPATFAPSFKALAQKLSK